MEIKKTVVPIAVVILFLGISLSPGISAENYENDSKLLTIWLPEITEDDYSIQMEVTQTDYNEINNSIDDFLTLVETAMDENSSLGRKIADSEWVDIKNSAIGLVNSIKTIVGDDFPDLDIETFIEGTLTSLFNPLKWFFQRAAIFSVGRGFSWIPFYDYEAFMGIMFRPIFITHIIGFTGALHFNPFPFRVEYADRIGLYRLTALAFSGIFINFGDITYDKIVGPILLIGRSLNFLGDDWP